MILSSSALVKYNPWFAAVQRVRMMWRQAVGLC